MTTEKIVDFPNPGRSAMAIANNISDAAAILEDARQKGGDELIAALEAIVLSNMLKRHHDGPVGGVLKLIFCAESLFGPLGLTVSPTGEGAPGFPILIEMPEHVDRILVGGKVFVKAVAA